MKTRSTLILCALALPLAGILGRASLGAPAQDKYTVEVLKEAPPKELSEELRNALAETGFRVAADGKAVCDVWLRKPLPVNEKFKPNATVNYGFARSQLVGAIRFPKDSHDIREQDLAGVYTMRYAQQPVDGNHIGTWPYSDFVAMLTPKQDPKPADRAEQEVIDLSMAGRTHPAILSLNPPGKREKLPAVVHDDSRDLWILAMPAQAKKGDKTADFQIELVVIGTAEI